MRKLLGFFFLLLASFLPFGIENGEIFCWWDSFFEALAPTPPHRAVGTQMRRRLLISSIVSTLFHILKVCGCVGVCVDYFEQFRCSFGVCWLQWKNKRYLQQFEEPNQRLGNFLCLVLSKAPFTLFLPFCSLLITFLLYHWKAAGRPCSSPSFVLTSFTVVAPEGAAPHRGSRLGCSVTSEWKAWCGVNPSRGDSKRVGLFLSF